MNNDKLIKRLKKTERGYQINQNAPDAFHSPKAMVIFVLISIAFSIFISWCFHGPYLSANAGAHVVIFLIVLGLLVAVARLILNMICALVRLFTLPALLRHRHCEKKLCRFEPHSRGVREFDEAAEVGLQYFIEKESTETDYYNVKFLE